MISSLEAKIKLVFPILPTANITDGLAITLQLPILLNTNITNEWVRQVRFKYDKHVLHLISMLIGCFSLDRTH